MLTWKSVLPGVIVLLVLAAALLIRPGAAPNSLALYTSVDAEYAIEMQKRFEKATGIQLELRTDSEVTKTFGILERLRKLAGKPDADVFWNSEQSATQILAREGLLEPYRSPSAETIPAEFKDPQGLWTGFGLRARVLIYNTHHVQAAEAPKSLEELTDPKWRGRFCIARPLFGTTRSHFVALVLALGEEKGFEFLGKLRENGSAGGGKPWILDGNSATRDRVAEGVFHVGLTDTDDVYSAMERHRPVNYVLCSQTKDWPGVFVIPNTVCLLKGGPNPAAGKKFIDFLLRRETEQWLAEQGMKQTPVRADVPVPKGYPKLSEIRVASVDPEKLAQHLLPLSVKIDRFLRGE